MPVRIWAGLWLPGTYISLNCYLLSIHCPIVPAFPSSGCAYKATDGEEIRLRWARQESCLRGPELRILKELPQGSWGRLVGVEFRGFLMSGYRVISISFQKVALPGSCLAGVKGRAVGKTSAMGWVSIC